MKVPFLNLRALMEPLRAQVDQAFGEIIDSAAFICGARVKAFEEAFARLHGAPYFLGTSSGTDALHLALWALDIGPGHGVLLPVNTFIATAEAVTLCGATPIFVDCDEYFLMDTNRLEELLSSGCATPHSSPPSSRGPQLTAIIPVHLYGQAANMAKVMELAERYQLKVIEDACQAHLGQCQLGDGERYHAGTMGSAGAFSFFPGKNLGAFGEAGGVATTDRALYEKMLLLRAHGAVERYVHELPGHNYRVEELQAAVLSIKLPHLPQWTEQRRRVAASYRELLADVGELELARERDGCKHVYHLFVIKVPQDKRDALRSHLAAKGIETGLHYPVPLHLTRAYAHLGYHQGDFPAAEEAAGRILSLPMCPTLSEEQIKYVAETIKAFFAKREA